MTNQPHICAQCGIQVSESELYTFDGQLLCLHCLEANTILCRECGERIWREDNEGTDGVPLCQNCYDERYTSCCDCGTLLHIATANYEDSYEGEEHPYCSNCYQRRFHNESIHDYYYKPQPIFYGEGPRFFGVELEIDGAGEDYEHAESLLFIANSVNEQMYIKHDGSLDDGLELVAHPLSLAEHLHHFPWEALCKKAAALGYLSHRATTCGLHIHVSRRAFGETERQQDAAIARILYFFEKHWEELLKFSRRTQRQLERWAARYGYKEQPMEILEYAKKGYHGGRYTCVNLQNSDTVEFRMFRGTLKTNTLLATLELVDRLCDVAINLSDEELRSLAWTTFVSGMTEDCCPELVQYFKSIEPNYGFKVKSFGHAGDGNLHIYTCANDMELDEFKKQVDDFMTKIYDKATEIGGLVSGEHGIGMGKIDYLTRSVGETNMKLMEEIKKVFDPNLILNPGKVCYKL